MTYSEALEWLYATQNFGIKLGLEAPKKLLRQFQANPTRDTKVIHVAGTNGKGSTCAIIDSLARATGLRCGLFTSPHLVSYCERVRVNGQMIPEETALEHLTELRKLVANWEHHPTFFELSLALAMKHFKEMQCELIILETGMGGRLDATTAVPADVCVITPIAMDHADWLGDTLEKVATEKAGIICEKKPVLSAKQERDAAMVIAEVADERRAPLSLIEGPLLGYSIKLAGKHQAENAKLAVESLTALGVQLDFDSVKYALANIHWPGRFETISSEPLIIIDGAHNPHAADALAQTWNAEFPNQKATLIFGAVDDKEASTVLEKLSAISDSIHLSPIDSPRSLGMEELEEIIPASGPNTTIHKDLASCLEALKNTHSPILIAGSLFLIGQAKALMENADFQSSTQ